MFAIYQSLLGWKTYNHYYETDEVPNPRPTQIQEKKKARSGIWATFSPQQVKISWGGIDFTLGNRLQEAQPNQTLRKHHIWKLLLRASSVVQP